MFTILSIEEYIGNSDLEDISEIPTSLISLPSIHHSKWEKKLLTYLTIGIFDTCRTFSYLSVALITTDMISPRSSLYKLSLTPELLVF